MEIEIISASSGKSLAILQDLQPLATILDVKKKFSQIKKQYYLERQSFKLEKHGKTLKDEDTLELLRTANVNKLLFKDLGPQVGWKTVFLTEYAGPLFIYLWICTRPALLYGSRAAHQPTSFVVHISAGCWTAHYLKRLLETLFVHRFSHATMPIRNIFKNCFYYWIFAAYVAYYVNHPLYTAPACSWHIYSSLAAFVFFELGNYSIHVALRDLRPPGSKERKIPRATSNPFTLLFNFVSCPNYTYEVGAWLSFSSLTQCVPALLFALAGGFQMLVWALGKHRNYKKEFSDYPKKRKAMIPFIM